MAGRQCIGQMKQERRQNGRYNRVARLEKPDRLLEVCDFSHGFFTMSSFDTSNVTNMNKMWYNCRSLTRLDLSNFDTSNVTGMDYSFYACHGMNTLILGEKFAFVGSTYSIPLSSWKNSSGETFDSDGTMSNIPSNVADVYSKM